MTTSKLTAKAEYIDPPLEQLDAHGRVKVTITNTGTKPAHGITLEPVKPLGYPYGHEYGEVLYELGPDSSATVVVSVHFTTSVEQAPAVPEFAVSATA